MSTESQIKANRRNAQKSTGPKTAEGKAAVAQNALKHGLFAHENVIKCEKQADFERFRDELMAGLAPVGGVEAMLAERIVSLSWRLKRVERMNSEAIDVMIAKIETDSLERRWRREAGLVDSESGKSELALGWAMIKDFSGSNVLERLLMYEKRIESSLYKAMNELQKLQRMRKREQAQAEVEQLAIPKASGVEAAHHCGRDTAQAIPGGTRDTQGQDVAQAIPRRTLATETDQMKKQSQLPAVGWKSEEGYLNTKDCEKQSQSSLSEASANTAANAKQSQSPTFGRKL